MKSAAIILNFDFPVTVSEYSIFDVGSDKSYIDWDKTQAMFDSQYKTFIKGELETLVNACHKNKQPLSAYFSGLFLKLLDKSDTKAVANLKKAVATKKLEILGGTYNHSLSSIYSLQQFEVEVVNHRQLMEEVFDVTPTRFLNTENIYFNSLVQKLSTLGFDAVFAGAIDWYLVGDPLQRVFLGAGKNDFNVLLCDTDAGKAFFEDENRHLHFLMHDIDLLGKLGGLQNVLKTVEKRATVHSISQLVKKYKPTRPYNIKAPVIGSIHGRSLKSFSGQAMQSSVIDQLYTLSKKVRKTSNVDLRNEFLALSQASQIRTMSTSEPDVIRHAPYDLYRKLINIMSDMELKLEKDSTRKN